MFRIWIFAIVIHLILMIGVVFAGEKYCFNCSHKYKVGDKENATYDFEFDLQNNELSVKVEEEISNKKTGLVSYILFENNKILVDENRKSKYTGPYPSHSIGKSLVSLVTGYAMCGGYINHTVYDRIDYPTVVGTLYENQKLIDLLNMQAGDDEIIGDRLGNWDSRLISNNKSINIIPIKTAMKRYFKNKDGLEPGTYYNYSAMTTNVIMNYVIYKTGDDWEKLLHKVFVEDAKVSKRVYFHKTLEKKHTGNRKSGEYGRYSFYADRYDYLRIANLMMNHWNNDTCVGKYLKTMYETKVDKNKKEYSNKRGNHVSAQSYGGQFHFDPIGLEDRPILMMDGFAGQQVVIDFNNNRIITIHSTDRHYDYYTLVYSALGHVEYKQVSEDKLIEDMWKVKPTTCTGTVIECLNPANEL